MLRRVVSSRRGSGGSFEVACNLPGVHLTGGAGSSRERPGEDGSRRICTTVASIPPNPSARGQVIAGKARAARGGHGTFLVVEADDPQWQHNVQRDTKKEEDAKTINLSKRSCRSRSRRSKREPTQEDAEPVITNLQCAESISHSRAKKQMKESVQQNAGSKLQTIANLGIQIKSNMRMRMLDEEEDDLIYIMHASLFNHRSNIVLLPQFHHVNHSFSSSRSDMDQLTVQWASCNLINMPIRPNRGTSTSKTGCDRTCMSTWNIHLMHRSRPKSS